MKSEDKDAKVIQSLYRVSKWFKAYVMFRLVKQNNIKLFPYLFNVYLPLIEMTTLIHNRDQFRQ